MIKGWCIRTTQIHLWSTPNPLYYLSELLARSIQMLDGLVAAAFFYNDSILSIILFEASIRNVELNSKCEWKKE